MSYVQSSQRLAELRELLEEKNHRKELIQLIDESYRKAATLFYDYDQIVIDKEAISQWRAMNDDEKWIEAWDATSMLTPHFLIDHVFSKLRMPWIIYPNELEEEFHRLMCPGGRGCPEMQDIDFETLYQGFVHIICLQVVSDRSKKIIVCRLEIESEESSELSLDTPVIDSYENQDIHICFNIEKTKYTTHPLTAEISGKMSSIAMDRFTDGLGEVLRTAINSIALLGGNPEYNAFSDSKFPIAMTSLQHFSKMITDYLDAYFAQICSPSGHTKDNLDRRICNAVQLLIEADRQRNSAIGLSLSIAAIEALLGDNTSELAETLAGHISTLLEPEEKLRRKPMDFFKDLYKKRSKALHGAIVDGEFKCLSQSRHIAAAVLAAILDRRKFFESSGFDRERGKNLITELTQLQYKPGLPLGVNEYNVRQYWSK